MNVERHVRAAACAALTLLTLCAAADVTAQKTHGRITRARETTKRRLPPAAVDDRADAYIKEGHKHADEGDWAAALKSYEQALAVNPRHPDAHIYVGDAYMSLGKYVEAFDAYQEAVHVAPANPEAHYSLGAAYNDMAMYGDAFKPFVRAIGLDPNYAEAHYGIGYAYLKLENYKEAVVYLKRAVRLMNDFPEAHLSLGLAYLGIGQLKPAQEELQTLEKTDAVLAKDLEREVRKVAAARPDTDALKNVDTSARVPKAALRQDSRKSSDEQTSPPVAPSSMRAAEDTAVQTQRAPVATTPDKTRPKGSAQSSSAEIATWDRIKNSDDSRDFEEYLRTYPGGEFAGLARIRLRVLEVRGGAPAVPRAGQRSEAAPQTSPMEAGVSASTDAPTREVPPRRGPTVEEALELLKSVFANKLTYTATAPGQEADVVKVTYEVVVEYEPLSFKDCRIQWRDRKDTLSVILSDLDPLSVKVEPRSRPNTTFSTAVWDVSVRTLNGAPTIRALKGDGSGAVNNYSDINLQLGGKEKAERLARLLQQVIILCKSGL